MRSKKQKAPARSRVLNAVLSLVLAAGLLPAAPALAAADDAAGGSAGGGSNLGSVHVVVENATCPAPAAAWTGILVDSEVALAADSTAMTCIKAAIEGAGKTQTGADNGYISDIAGLSEHDGDDYDPEGKGYSGWMGTLNDWFTDMGFANYTVANGLLSSGDEIRVMYTCTGGSDLGNYWGSADKTLKSIEFSAGALNQEFAPTVHEYELTVPEGTTAVKVAPTAANKAFQVRTFVGGAQYKRSADVPVADGAAITVKCGYANFDATDAGGVETYTFTVKVSADAPEPEAKVLDSGELNNVTWTVYDNGVLKLGKIDGTDGKMKNSSQWSTPVYSRNYGKTITSIVIDEGITYLGDYVLSQLTQATSISFPASLTDMGSNALYGCSSVTTYNCAEGGSISVDGNYLLKDHGATLLKVLDTSLLVGTVTLPDSVTSIGEQFRGAKNMTGIVLPAGLQFINGYAFQGCTGLTEIVVPCNLRGGDYALQGCTNLTTITFSEGVTSVMGGAFGYLENLTTINFPSTLTELDGSLIASSVTTVNIAEGSVFSSENGVITKTTDSGTEIVKVLSNASIVDEAGVLTIPEGVTTIGDSAYKGRDEIKSIVFPSTLKTIGGDAFSGCENLAGELVIPAGVTTLGRFAFGSTGITKAVIPAGVTTMGSQLFDYCNSLKEVVIGSNISGSVFMDNPALETITLAEGVTSVGERAFRGTKSTSHAALTTINLPASLESFDASALENDDAVATINCAEGGAFAFANGVLTNTATHAIAYVAPTTSGDFVVPTGTLEIGPSAFAARTGITSVSLPEGLTTIGAKAFDGCSGIAGELVIPSTVKTVGDYAFENCTGLTKVNCLDPVPSAAVDGAGDAAAAAADDAADDAASEITYGYYAFAYDTGLTEVHLPEGLITYNKLLYEAKNLTTLALPETVTTLRSGGQNFRGMAGLRSLSMPGVKALGSMEFYVCQNLETLDMPSIETISSGAFSSVGTHLKEMYLSKNLTTFANNTMTYPAFIYYPGSQEDWANIELGSNVMSNIEKYGTTVVYNYKAASEPLTVVAQPANIAAYKGLKSEAATFEVSIPEGASAYYFWYDGSGACVSNGTSASFTTASSAEGTFTYYCVAKVISPDGTVYTAQSNPFTLTVSSLEGIFEGSGTEEDPYLLKTAQDLTNLSSIVSSGESYAGTVFKMANSIELPTGWSPIGATKDGSENIQGGNNMNAFAGTFDGGSENGYVLTVPAGEKPLFNFVYGATIKNLNIYGTQINGYGLIDKWYGIGLSGVGVTIDNVTLKAGTSTLKSGLLGGEITTNVYAGVSAGYTASISNCTIEEGVIIGYDGTQDKIGSFAGRFQGTIDNCVSHATVKGVNYVGGLIGTRDNAMGTCFVSGSTFDGTVLATGKNAGGIAGGGYENSTAPNGVHISIDDCAVSGAISGKENVGGILGGDEYIAQA